LLQEEGTHTVRVDEMTGIQALERIAPTKPMKPGPEERREFAYTRQGTRCLIGNFAVAAGEVMAPTVPATRTEEDFRTPVAETVATDAGAGWIFVADNLTTHGAESLVRYVARPCGIAEDLGKKGRRGVLKSVATRKAFLTDPGHRIRFVYVPKHTSWLHPIAIGFRILVRRVLKRGNFTSVADLREKLVRFIAYFNEVFAKPFRWTFTGRPLQT